MHIFIPLIYVSDSRNEIDLLDTLYATVTFSKSRRIVQPHSSFRALIF